MFSTITLEDFIKKYVPDWNEEESLIRFKRDLLCELRAGDISQEKYNKIMKGID